MSLKKIKKLLSYTTTSNKQYNGVEYEGGYHTLKINDTIVKGQRNPAQRFEGVNFDFNGKTVLDIGSNQGGMLYEVQDKIKKGVGVDFDYRLVNVSNRISQYNGYNNLSFYVFDADSENFNLLNDFSDQKYDVVFLLAVCMWIKSWKDLIKWVYENSNYCLFETNGKKDLQSEQISYLKGLYSSVELIHKTSEDDPKQKKRSTYWCKK